MRKKNILVLNYEFPPLGGGQANANYQLFKEFSKYPHYSFTLITSSHSIKKEEAFSQNINIYYVDIKKNNTNLHSQSIKNLLSYTFQAYKLSKKIIQDQQIHSIMCWSYPAIGIGYLLYKKFKVPYVSLLRGSETPFYEKKWKLLDTCIFQFLTPVFWRNSKYVIANSQGLRDLAHKNSPKQKIYIVENGVGIQDFNIDKKRPNKKFCILYIGRLTERKGVHHLIKSFSDFAYKRNDTQLSIVGSGEEEGALKKMVGDYKLDKKVQFYGSTAHEDLPMIYNSHNIYVLPSSNEGMSNTLLEAMASSLPIIITDIGGTKELFNENGWIINIGDTDDLRKKLGLAYTLWKNKKLEELGKKSFNIVKSRSWKKKAEEFIQYI